MFFSNLSGLYLLHVLLYFRMDNSALVSTEISIVAFAVKRLHKMFDFLCRISLPSPPDVRAVLIYAPSPKRTSLQKTLASTGFEACSHNTLNVPERSIAS